MAKKYLDDNGLLYLWGKIKEKFALKTHTHTKSEITDFPATMPPASHTHGNITNTGTLQTTDVAIANGDKLVITDSSNSSKVARASLSFDGATTTKALTQKGTWETFLTSADVPEGASASSTTPIMDGTAAVGTETSFARGDHVHPSDTSRVPTTRTVNGHALSANVTVTASDIGVESGAEVNVLEGVQMNGTDLTITSKKVNIPVFTGVTSSADGSVGLVPAPTQSAAYTPNQRVLCANGSWVSKVVTGIANGIQSNTAVINITKPDGGGNTETLRALAYSSRGANNGVAPLNSNGTIDTQYLPSFVDDVIEAYARANQTELGSTWLATESATGTVITPEAGKIYVLMNSSTNYEQNTQFRWGGTAYVQLNDSGCTAITNTEIDTILAS